MDTTGGSGAMVDQANPGLGPRRVLLLKGAYEPHGGTESVLSGFLDHMDRSRYQPYLVVLSKPGGPAVPQLMKDPASVPQKTLPWGGSHSLETVRALAAMVRDDGIREY
jgi:hypothetical protein